MRQLALPLSARPFLAAALTTLCLPAPAALAATLTVTGIEVSGYAGFKLTVPSVETTDSNLDEDAIRAIFAGDLAGTAGQLAELDAASIRIPEIRLVYDIPGADGAMERSEVVYRDLELTDVVDGVAGSAAIGGAEVFAGEGVTWTFGRMSSGLFDIGGLLGFYGLGGKSGSSELKPVYADFVFEGMQISGPDFSCDVGAARVGEFSARPLQTSFQEIMTVAQQMEALEKAGEKPTPEAIAKMVAFYVDMLTAFESAPTEFDGFTCSGKDDTGKPIEIKSGSMTMAGFEPGTYPAIGLNDFRIDVENDGWMEFGNFTFKSMDFNGAIATLKQAGSNLDEAWFATNWRKLIPVFDGLSMSGFGMDIPDESDPGERIQAAVGTFDVSLADYVNGIPARIALSASDIEIAIPADAGDGVGEQFAALGLDKLDLGYDVALHWDEANQNIIVDRFGVTGENLGFVRVSGTLGNATADLFSDNLATATAASAALTVKDLHIEIEDNGLSTAIIALAAKQENQEPAAFRAVLSGLAQAMPLAMLGPNQESVALGAALRAFVDGTPKLEVTVTAKDPAGITLADLEAFEKDPTVLSGKVTIVAEASGEPRPVADPAPAVEPDAGPGPQPSTGTEISPRQQEKQGTKQ